jgi:hypothetical protein
MIGEIVEDHKKKQENTEQLRSIYRGHEGEKKKN